MADRSKFEKMLELLVNEDKEAAQELFHELVVEKSRDIYESLLEDEDKEVDEADDEEVDESDEDLDENDDEEVDESDEDLDEGFDLDEFEVEADPMDMGGDPADDMMMDLEPGDDDDDMDDMDMDMDGEEGDVEDRIDDIEDALEDLKAEFEKMMSGDDEDDMDMDDGDDDMDMDMDADDEEEKESFRFESDDEDDDEIEESKKMKKDDKKKKKSAGEEMREYVEKIGGDRYNAYGKMGDNGTNTKSPVAKPNNMGGTTQNILRGDTEDSGEANKGALKGSPINDTSPTDMKTGNINVPGGKASKAQKKIAGGGIDNNSPLKKDSTDSSAKSPINGVKTRAK